MVVVTIGRTRLPRLSRVETPNVALSVGGVCLEVLRQEPELRTHGPGIKGGKRERGESVSHLHLPIFRTKEREYRLFDPRDLIRMNLFFKILNLWIRVTFTCLLQRTPGKGFDFLPYRITV